MPSADSFYSFFPDGITFSSSAAMGSRLIYAPLCGIDGAGIKSSITPFLGGDIKVDKFSYVNKPASREDLRSSSRNLFVAVEGKGLFSFAELPLAGDQVEAGQLWHRVVRQAPALGLELSALSFVPVSGEKLELTRFTVRNVSSAPVKFTATTAFVLFGRALANKHDHEHVTALLNRIDQCPEGVVAGPTMAFNEEGHKLARAVYYVFGCSNAGQLPEGSFPTFESFFGEGGTFECPSALINNALPRLLSEAEREGQEAVGSLRFSAAVLAPGQESSFIVAIGTAETKAAALVDFARFATPDLFAAAWAANSVFWAGKTAAVQFHSADPAFTSWMRWVALQPVLRRIYGCSFLPDHDYGKGGKGWRDIWQDLLSLILIEPGEVRGQLLNNFAGVRIDGTNATIIGQQPGEFIADRNAITRVWMDHGVWPFTTTQLYIDQSGDAAFLFELVPYFCDPQQSRSFGKNEHWVSSHGNQLKAATGEVYQGTVLEHILVQHLVQFFNVGGHNITRLESADWNDGLDMAFKHGESVAFMSFYAGNLFKIADLLEAAGQACGRRTIRVAAELRLLLDTLSLAVDYNDAAAKRARLFDEYFKAVHPAVSGETVELAVAAVAADLRHKGQWAFGHIRAHEMVSFGADRWFNGYYDNDGARVEGHKNGRVWMTLTGQVFPLMSGLATREEAREVVKAVEHFLKDPQLGGYRLNTDFGLRTYLSFGRAFGFAFGTKENGAVFSHMVVMYAYALYAQGLSREGYRALRSLYDMSRHPYRARIYPGVPEYFDASGRGMYHFLTGSASWYVLTLLTQAYGVRGCMGDLVLAPQLVLEEFNAQGEARVDFQFAGRPVAVVYSNPARLDAGAYRVEQIFFNGVVVPDPINSDGTARLERALFRQGTSAVELRVELSRQRCSS
ncbi:MAG: cellobiose phosphorylase [Candidatus Omnitrophica bacterium]|nr:cellobiose phosphorylase [Candidatus Omnitrophota bacterium]